MSSFVRQFQGFHRSLLLLPQERQVILGNIRLHMGRYPIVLLRTPRARLHFRRFFQPRTHTKTGAEAPV
jgi:hypothetical protein